MILYTVNLAEGSIMPYNYNPHRHVKIWLTKNQDIFLNLENQLRLIEMRRKNPSDEIHLIYDQSILSATALNNLKSFCSKHKIIPHDVQDDIIPYCYSEEELLLITIYQEEIRHLSAGGNLAVCSDLLRWLQPIYILGTYSDFDVYIDTSAIPNLITVDKPLLFSLGTVATSIDEVEALIINNHTIAVVDAEAALVEIQKIQRALFSACSSNCLSFLKNHLVKIEKNVRNIFEPAFPHIPNIAERILSQDRQLWTLIKTFPKKEGLTALELRESIITNTKDNYSYSAMIIRAYGIDPVNIPEEDLIRTVGTLERDTQRGKQSSNQDPLSIEEANLLITKIRKALRLQQLKTCVVYTSGPGLLMFALFDEYHYKKEIITSKIAPLSFSYYMLEKAFHSKNNLPLHSPSINTLLGKAVGDINDLSWLEEGHQAILLREEKIEKATATFHRFYRAKKNHVKHKAAPELLQMELNESFRPKLKTLSAKKKLILKKLSDTYISYTQKKISSVSIDWATERARLDGGAGGFLIDNCYNPNFMDSILQIICEGLFDSDDTVIYQNAQNACLMFEELYKKEVGLAESLHIAWKTDKLAITQLKKGSLYSALMTRWSYDKTDKTLDVPSQSQLFFQRPWIRCKFNEQSELVNTR